MGGAGSSQAQSTDQPLIEATRARGTLKGVVQPRY